MTKTEESSLSAYIFILICDCVQRRLLQQKENGRGHSYASLSQAAMLASIINQNQDTWAGHKHKTSISSTSLPLPN